MTEHIYGMWKRRWPIIKHMQEDLETGKESIDATAVLHNLTIIWNGDVPPLEHGELDPLPGQEPLLEDQEDDEDPDFQYVIVEDNVPRKNFFFYI